MEPDDEEKTMLISTVVDEALKEIYSGDTKHINLKRLKNSIKILIDKKKHMPEMILETLINKLSSIMEVIMYFTIE